jgi:thioredoxin-like negative regulator of GroEL
MTDKNGMIPLPSHEAFEDMLKPRGNRPSQDPKELTRTFKPWVAICFSAKWCGPCQRLDKAIIVRETPGIVWYSCDVDENDTTLGYCGLHGIPGFVLLKDGMFVDRKKGAADAADVLLWLLENGAPVKAA